MSIFSRIREAVGGFFGRIRDVFRGPQINVPRAPLVTSPRAPVVSILPRQTAISQQRAHVIDQVQWTMTPQSSWVKGFRYLASRRQLQVWFKSDAVCEYANIPPGRALSMAAAKSKGKFVWRWLYYLSYTLVRTGLRKIKRRRKLL